jgi:hypothetical protein
MEQSHPLSHGAVIRVVLEDKVINSNTATIVHRLSASTQITWGPHYRRGHMILPSLQYRRRFVAQRQAFTD